LATGLREGPKPFLGEPPGDVERHALLESFYGRPAADGDVGLVRGVGASPGIGEGPARVMRGAEDLSRVRHGDVLVTTTTTPAWTPLFRSLAGLVTETGGVLSHAAIVAREYGLPTVVGAAGATSAIPDGRMVRVDGAAGEVRLLDA
jgi:phosphoenolpyruvate synthase/pyruvate phosphate dikinase